MSLAEIIDDISPKYINDDGYFNDTCCDVFAEIRAIYLANNIDDKLAAVDALKLAIERSLSRNKDMMSEAQELLEKSRMAA